MLRSIFGELRTRPLMILCVVCACLAIISFVFPRFIDAVPFVSQLLHSLILFMPIGAVIGMALFWWWRVGESLHCPKCDYEFAYAADAAIPHASHCPECGTQWHDRWVKGRREVPWPRFVVLALCAAIGLAFCARNVAVYTSFGTARAPMWLLLRQLREDPGTDWLVTDRLWSGIQGRTLDLSTELELASLAIDAIRRDERSSTARNWLREFFNSTRMPASQVSRYLEQRLDVSWRLVTEDGQPRVFIRAVDFDTFGIGTLTVVLDRCWIDPGDSEVTRQEDWFPSTRGSRVNNSIEVRLLRNSRPAGESSLSIPLPSEARGSVKARFWVFWSPGHARASRVSPRQLAENPALDSDMQLVRTIELEALIPDPGSR